MKSTVFRPEDSPVDGIVIAAAVVRISSSGPAPGDRLAFNGYEVGLGLSKGLPSDPLAFDGYEFGLGISNGLLRRPNHRDRNGERIESERRKE